MSRIEDLLEELVRKQDEIVDKLDELVDAVKEMRDEKLVDVVDAIQGIRSDLSWTDNVTFANMVTDGISALQSSLDGIETNTSS